ncbi:MAG: AMP-binding protein [Ilumatobacteraceae bacterium]
MLGDLHILDDEMNELPMGKPGTIWFKTATPFEYHNDPGKTAESTSPDGTMTTVGDVGYVDEDNFLYLTDRKTFAIISGGVNIYPQETEDLLITHPKVADPAVIGVPNEDLGEGEGDRATDARRRGERRTHRGAARALSRPPEPSEGAALDRLPRRTPPPPTGKLYKRKLRDEFWADGNQKIV